MEHPQPQVLTPLFPLKKYYIDEKRFATLIRNLREYEPEISSIPLHFKIRGIKLAGDKLKLRINPVDGFSYGRSYVILSDFSYNERFTDLAYYFSEESLINTHRKGSVSVKEYYESNCKTVEAHALAKYNSTSIFHLRESIFDLFYEPTEFKPHVAMAIYKLFKPKRVLDFSAGRGVRLLGAILANVEVYTGVDPDADAMECCRKIIRHKSLVKSKSLDVLDGNAYKAKLTTAFNKTLQLKLIQAPFQTLELKEIGKGYDLVFTSPPYFDLESYSNESVQSAVEFPLVKDWINGFLIPSIELSLSALRRGGYLALNLGDPKDVDPFCGKTLKYLFEKEDLEYIGVVAYAHRVEGSKAYKSPQPVWIFKRF